MVSSAFVKPREHTVIGIDIGGTKIAGAVMRAHLPETGQVEAPPAIISRVTGVTSAVSADACLEGLAAVIEGLVEAVDGVDGIGLGTASSVDFEAGRIVASVNLPLEDVPIRDILERRLGVPVAVDNDATVAAIGEWAWGAGVGTREMIMLTLGTGVGGGIICRGRPYRGFSGAAAELGHIIIDMAGPPCPGDCPNHGCLEAYASGTAMGIAAVEEARQKPLSVLGKALAAGEVVDGKLLTLLAQQGDQTALDVVARVGEYLGAGLVTLVNTFNPERIVIGGGAAAAGELLLGPARRVVAHRALRPARDEVSVVPAALGPDAGMIGAGALALMELFPDAAGPLS